MNEAINLDDSCNLRSSRDDQRKFESAARSLRVVPDRFNQTERPTAVGEGGTGRSDRRDDVSLFDTGSRKRWLTRAEAGEYMGVHPRTLANWAAKGRGPRYSKPSGNSCMYRIDDLDAYLEACLVPTDDQSEAA
ncbi:helix-turn-helix transcriptional regulator [Nocardia nova]|uniref:helix-turn-helix transcriptional regulator n=1 Tax=Nocardia nova TaxID=37330 RepID=UPI00379BCF45